MPQPKRFRILAKNYFITYSRCALSLEQALSQLKNLNTPLVNEKFIRVCREKHDDGDYHLHVLIQFEGKYVCTNPRFFDLVSPSRPAHYHPNNTQGAKSSSDVKSFIEKDGEFLDWGEFQIDGTSSRGGGQRQQLNKVYASVLNATSKTEALQIIKEGDPKGFFRHYRRLDSNLGEHFAETTATFVPKWNPSSFRIPDSWQQWVSKNIVNDAAARPHRPKSIIIEGPSGVGKTEWARSLGPHNYLSGRLNFIPKTFRNDVAYNVIDNVAPKNLARKYWKKLIGSNYHWQADCKYSKPVLIKGSKPSIVLCNPGRDSSYKEFLDKKKNMSLKDWTLLNAEFYFIDNPIFSTEPEGLIHEQRPTPV